MFVYKVFLAESFHLFGEIIGELSIYFVDSMNIMHSEKWPIIVVGGSDDITTKY